MVDLEKEGLSIVHLLRQKFPNLWWFMLLVAGISFVGTVSIGITRDWIPFIWITCLLLLAIFFAILPQWTKAMRWSGFWHNVSIVGLILSLAGFVVSSTQFSMNFFANAFAFCGEDRPDDCAKTRLEISGTIRPDGTVTVSAAGTTELSVPFAHRRSSCSNRSYGSFEACLLTDGTVENVAITEFWDRNGRFEPSNLDGAKEADMSGLAQSPWSKERNGNAMWAPKPDAPNCVLIPWSAASLGRTGIGECRGHGEIKFTAKLTGSITVQKSEPAVGVPFPIITQGNQKSHVFEYKADNPNFTPTIWTYDVKVTQKSRSLDRDIVDWVDFTDHDHTETPCLGSELITPAVPQEPAAAGAVSSTGTGTGPKLYVRITC